MASRQIVAGPGKFDMMVALFDYRKAHFSFDSLINQFPARITAVETAEGEETWNLKGFILHSRPIQDRQDFAATYSTITRKGSATFQETCKICEGPLGEKGFCQHCAGGLPLEVCAALQLKTLPHGGATIGFSLTSDESACLQSTGRVTLKNCVTFGLRINQHVHLYEVPGNKLVDGQARVTNIMPLPPEESHNGRHVADVEIIR